MKPQQKPIRFLVLQHTTGSPGGSTGDWIVSQGHHLEQIMVSSIKEWPALDSFDVLILCGGAMNVDQDDKYPWMKMEKSFIQSAIQNDKKVVGLCLGAQLIAEVLGADVGPLGHWETGWHKIKMKTEGSKILPVDHELIAFQYHAYCFKTPAQTHAHGSSLACEHQAYSFEDRVFGFQFHPESTKEWITECILDKEDPYPTGPYVQDGEEVLAQLKNQDRLQKWYHQFLFNLTKS